jgi:hypothetical protein
MKRFDEVQAIRLIPSYEMSAVFGVDDGPVRRESKYLCLLMFIGQVDQSPPSRIETKS